MEAFRRTVKSGSCTGAALKSTDISRFLGSNPSAPTKVKFFDILERLPVDTVSRHDRTG